MTVENKPKLDLRIPGTITSLVGEDRTPIIAPSPEVDFEDGSSRFLVLVPKAPLEPGDLLWTSMGGTYSVARRGRVTLEPFELFEVGEAMMHSIVAEMKAAETRKNIQEI